MMPRTRVSTHRRGGRRSARLTGSVAGAALAVAALVAACGSPASVHRSVATTAAASRTSSAGPSAPAVVHIAATSSPLRLRTPLARPAVAVTGGHILVAGGLTDKGESTSGVEVIDPGRGTVRADGRLSQPIHDAAGIIAGGHPFVAGGGTQSVSDVVQRIIPGGNGSQAGRLPTPRADLAGISTATAAYLIGGYDGSRGLPQVLRTADGTRYQVVADLPVPVRYPAVARWGSAIWVFGGEHDGRLTDVIQRIDLKTSRATVAGRLPAPLGHAGAFVIDGQLLVAGGKTRLTPADTETAQVLAFDPRTRTTHRVGTLPAPVSDFGVAVLHGIGYLVGGEHGGPVRSIMSLQINGGHA
ncbi:hypothetical protein [Flexivirga sp.]|uniref:hypothetical protein n=1 Tax=Flexivirga sp. TaxID=1962927 RepID=UPI003F81136C